MKNLITTAFVVSLAGTAFAQLNPSFESGTAGDADSWIETAFGGPAAAAERTDNVFRTGAWSMLITVDGEDGIGTRAFVEQGGIAVSEGYEVQFNVYGRLDAGAALGPGVVGGVYIGWFDSMGGFMGISGTGYAGSINASWQEFGHTSIAPAGAATALVGFDLSGGAFAASDGTAYFDDASVTVIPAPASASLALLGLGVAARRRRC